MLFRRRKDVIMPIEMSVVIAFVLLFVTAYMFVLYSINKKSGKNHKSFKAKQNQANVGEHRK